MNKNEQTKNNDNQSEAKVISNNKDYKMTRLKRNSYLFEYDINNSNIQLSKILDIDIIKLIYELNKHDIFENFYLNIRNNSQATVFILFKHFYEDFGISQKYINLDISLERTDSQIIYKATTNPIKPINKETGIELLETNLDAELLPVYNVTTICELLTPHNVVIKTTTEFENTKNMLDVPEFLERLATNIISKIFLRTKQFIEKVNITNIA